MCFCWNSSYGQITSVQIVSLLSLLFMQYCFINWDKDQKQCNQLLSGATACIHPIYPWTENLAFCCRNWRKHRESMALSLLCVSRSGCYWWCEEFFLIPIEYLWKPQPIWTPITNLLLANSTMMTSQSTNHLRLDPWTWHTLYTTAPFRCGHLSETLSRNEHLEW